MKKRLSVFFLIGMIISASLAGCGKLSASSLDRALELLQEKRSEAEESTQADNEEGVKVFTRKPDMESRDNHYKLTSIWWIESEYDADGNTTKMTYYVNDTDMKSRVGKIAYWWELEHDSNGNISKHITYNPDGSINDWKEYEWDSDGNMLKYTIYNPDGSIEESGTPKH